MALAAPALRAEKIPALVEVPAYFPEDMRVRFSQERGDLGAEFRSFKADSDAFNALKAEQQDDGVYQQLLQRRQAYIARAKDFNARVVRQGDMIVLQRAPTAGVAAAVRGECWYTLPGGTRVPIRSGDPIPAGSVARLQTGDTGRVQLLLADQTTFTIGPGSDMLVDEFVYDPDTSLKKASIEVVVGFFRYVTGKIAQARPDSMKVTCPVGSLGIRGTDFETVVAQDGSTTIRLFQGEVVLTPKGGGPDITLKGRQQLRMGPLDTTGQPSALPDSAEPSL
jgi:hypothetical protein